MKRLFLALLAVAFAQRVEFEVASIKVSPYEGKGGIGTTITGGRLTALHDSLHGLIAVAYDVEDFQVEGGPAWAHSRDLYGTDRFDVNAKAPGEVAPPAAQVRQMLQALLTDRFQLRLRRETREFPAFALTVTAGGSKMKANPPAPSVPPSIWSAGRMESRYEAKAISMNDLTFVLRTVAGRPVVDRTGLQGTYEFTLRYAAGDPPPPQATAPSIFTAVQEQLGLKLESVRAPFEVIVIESAQRPSAN